MDLCFDMDSPLHLFYRLRQILSAEQASVRAFQTIVVDIFRVRISAPERPKAEKIELDPLLRERNEQLDIGLPECKT